MDSHNPSTDNQHEVFVWPPSVQSDLFNYLKPEQQEFVRPLLAVLKKPAQEELCCSLLDYLEHGQAIPPADLLLSSLFMYVTRVGMEDFDSPDDHRILRPLHYTEPERDSGEVKCTLSSSMEAIGTILKQMFNPSNH